MPLVPEKMNCTLSWILLGGILLFAFALRAVNLGGPDFGIDEILHVYAASSLLEENRPLVPSGIEYTRGLPFTKLVALVGGFWGINEKTARIPSLVFGLLTVLFVFHMGRSWYSNSVGLIAAFLIAVGVEEVFFSRYVRMYAMFQFLYLIVIYTLFEAMERPPTFFIKNGSVVKIMDWFKKIELSPILLITSGILCFFITFHIHALMAPAMLGPVFYVMSMAMFALFIMNMPRGRKIKYVGLVSGVLLITIGIMLFRPDAVQKFLGAGYTAPYWAQENVGNWRYYRDVLALRYPIILGTIGLTSIYALVKFPKITFYLITCVVAPIIVHSFFFSWKSHRYIFHLMPLIFLLFAAGISSLISYLYNGLKLWAVDVVGQLGSRIVAGALVIMSLAFMIGSTSWFSMSLNVPRSTGILTLGIPHNNWKSAMKFIADESIPSDIIVTPWPLLTKYYGPDLPQYALNKDVTDGFQPQMVGDAKIIPSLDILMDVISKHKSGWIITEGYRFKNLERAFPSGVKNFLMHKKGRVDVPSAQDMLVWRWK